MFRVYYQGILGIVILKLMSSQKFYAHHLKLLYYTHITEYISYVGYDLTNS